MLHKEDELKTLKDFESHIKESIHNRLCKKLRQEAIKWVKEDLELVKNAESHKILNRWMKRLDITAEDLK